MAAAASAAAAALGQGRWASAYSSRRHRGLDEVLSQKSVQAGALLCVHSHPILQYQFVRRKATVAARCYDDLNAREENLKDRAGFNQAVKQGAVWISGWSIP